MPATKPQRVLTKPRITTPTIATPTVGRAIGDTTDAVRQVSNRLKDRTDLTVSLAIGDNRIAHGLGRKPRGYTITPSVADATFAHALKAADDKVLTITVVGAAQPNAVVEVFS